MLAFQEGKLHPVLRELTRLPGLAEIAATPQWMTWSFWQRDPTAKPAKVPHPPGEYRGGSVTKPDDWGTFKEAYSWLRHAGGYGMDGVGFVFTAGDPYWGVDLDDCIGPDVTLEPWARDVLDRVPTYTEVSPSGRGLKLIGWGTPPCRGFNRRPVEFYSEARFFTVTGNHYPDTPVTIESPSQGLSWFCDLYGPETYVELGQLHLATSHEPLTWADEYLLDAACRAVNGEIFYALFYQAGQGVWWLPSSSECDLSLCCRLAWWTQGDPERIDRIFRHSSLYRRKWDEDHGGQTYGDRTIETAIQHYESENSNHVQS